MPHNAAHDTLGWLGNLLNPILFVVFAVASYLAWKRRALPEPLGALWARVALLCVCGWLIDHPEKVWHGFKTAFPHFDPSGHTAFFLIPGLALCVVDAKWARGIVPLGLCYAVFMVMRGYHKPLEIILTALIFAPIVWAALMLRRRQPVLPAEAINSPA